MQPQPLPPPGPPSRDELSSFAAGYLIDEGPVVSTTLLLAHQEVVGLMVRTRCCNHHLRNKFDDVQLTGLWRYRRLGQMDLLPGAAITVRLVCCAQNTGICGTARRPGA